MGLFVLLSALFAATGETIREARNRQVALEEKARYETIDWDNIVAVTLVGTETAYRTYEEEEFDIVATNYLSEMDGWPHYETQTVEYQVEDGENYCFIIRYKNCAEIYRKFHETSPLTERLLEYVDETDFNVSASLNKDPMLSRFNGIINDSLALLEKTVNPETYFSRYKLVFDNANRILEDTQVRQFREYAEDIITDLTVNKAEKHISFIDRLYFKERLISFKEQLLSDKYDIAPEAKEHLKSLLEELEAEKKVNLPNLRYAVIDIETTGLNYNFNRQPADEIISVAIIDQDENVLLDTYCDTVNVKSWTEAERIHGISPNDVKGYSTFTEILPKVIEILLSYDYVIAYNIKFEKLFIQNYAYHYAREHLLDFFKITWGEDPMKIFMNYMGSTKFFKLETAARHFGYTYDAHNALEDTKATLYIYKSMHNDRN